MNYKDNAPEPGRSNCVADTHNSTEIKAIYKSRKAQRASILLWLNHKQSITTLEARTQLGIMHPAGRIKELRQTGHNIETAWTWDKDTTGKTHKQAKYVLLNINRGTLR